MEAREMRYLDDLAHAHGGISQQPVGAEQPLLAVSEHLKFSARSLERGANIRAEGYTQLGVLKGVEKWSLRGGRARCYR